VQSDNIINTSFCPRVDRDSIDLFTSALTFDPHSVEQSRLEMLVHEGGETGATRAYKPPLSEFSMIITQVNAGAKDKLTAVNNTMVVTSGSGIMRVNGKEVDLSFKFSFIRQGVNVEFETEEKMMEHRACADTALSTSEELVPVSIYQESAIDL
jgi:mannose-6-phosphate isomerase